MATAEEYLKSMLELGVDKSSKAEAAFEEQSSNETRLTEANAGRWNEGDTTADAKVLIAIHKLEKDVLYWQDKRIKVEHERKTKLNEEQHNVRIAAVHAQLSQATLDLEKLKQANQQIAKELPHIKAHTAALNSSLNGLGLAQQRTEKELQARLKDPKEFVNLAQKLSTTQLYQLQYQLGLLVSSRYNTVYFPQSYSGPTMTATTNFPSSYYSYSPSPIYGPSHPSYPPPPQQ